MHALIDFERKREIAGQRRVNNACWPFGCLVSREVKLRHYAYATCNVKPLTGHKRPSKTTAAIALPPYCTEISFV